MYQYRFFSRSITALLGALCLCCTTVSAQLTDAFNDGNFTADPTWLGDTAHFKVNAAGELQLDAPSAGISFIGTPVTLPYATVWDFRVRMEFGPSLTNMLRVWLAVDTVGADIEGYLLEIGENGSSDALRLLTRKNGVNTLIAKGVEGTVATDPTEVRVTVQRNTKGLWVASLALPGSDPVQQFAVTDTTFQPIGKKLFGFNCIYTETRKDKYFFDDIRIQPDSSDLTTPSLLDYEIVNAQTLRLFFNKPLDSVSCRNIANYNFNGTQLNGAVAWTAQQPAQLDLLLANPLVSQQPNTLLIQGVTDWLGMAMPLQTLNFTYIVEEQAVAGDILINEIMYKPSPSQGTLPATAEWIELINRSDKPLRLSRLTFADGSSTPKNMPDWLLAPDSMVVVCSTTQWTQMQTVTQNVIGVVGFPALNDDGDELTIANLQGEVIDYVAYEDDWHTDDTKKSGGWSLERINPELLCLGADNWASCPAFPGGSPGARNLAYSDAPDTTAPRPTQVTLLDAQTIQVTFSEAMDTDALTDPNNYLFTPNLTLATVTPTNGERSTVSLRVTTEIPTKTLYELRFAATMQDCSGNPVASEALLVFGVPEAPEPGDALINELLFNPATGGSRFVEVHNNSDKILDWKAFFLRNANGVKIPIATERLFLPGDYFAFTPNRADILARYPDAREGRVETQLLPSLDDKSGNISLYWAAGADTLLLDGFDYSDSYHSAFLSSADKEGRSLERIRFDAPTNNANNWISAAGKGTPTLPNGQSGNTLAPQDDFVALSSSRISPDGDGREDYLDIVWTLDAAGYAATATVYDSEGVPVKKIARQELIGTNGSLRWDGDTEDQQRVRPGIYVLYVEIFNDQGDIKRAKLPFAVVF